MLKFPWSFHVAILTIFDDAWLVPQVSVELLQNDSCGKTSTNSTRRRRNYLNSCGWRINSSVINSFLVNYPYGRKSHERETHVNFPQILAHHIKNMRSPDISHGICYAPRPDHESKTEENRTKAGTRSERMTTRSVFQASQTFAFWWHADRQKIQFALAVNHDILNQLQLHDWLVQWRVLVFCFSFRTYMMAVILPKTQFFKSFSFYFYISS
jgi:hypothetical protein